MMTKHYFSDEVVITKVELNKIWNNNISLANIMAEFRALTSQRGLSYDLKDYIGTYWNESGDLCLRNYVVEGGEEEDEDQHGD